MLRKHFIKNYSAKPSLGLLTLVLLGLLGCAEQIQDDPIDTEVDTALVLATVNGEPITEADVNFTIDRTFSEADQLFMDEEVMNKVLESLIASKAMAQSVRSQLSGPEMDLIDSKVKAYEEELYIKEYLTANAVPEPVTTQMVEEYYRNNPEKFGSKTVKEFEQLTAARKLTEAERDRLLGDVQAISRDEDWSRVAEDSRERYPLAYQRARAAAGLLEPEYDKVVQALAPEDPARLLFVDESPVILRVVAERVTPAKPLHEVSAEIRKTLAPMQLRKAVKQASEDVLAAAEVVRMDAE